MSRYVISSMVGVLVSFLLAGCEEASVPVPPKTRPIAWIKVREADLSQVRRLSGVVRAAETATLSFEIGGKIKKVHASLGDHVTKGDVLAVLDDRSYDLNSQAAKGRLQEAQAQLVDAENEFDRQSKLFNKGWASRSAYDKAKAGLDGAKSALKVAQAELELSQKDLVDTALTAPYDGNITARLIEPSQQVTAGQACFEIEGTEGLEISVRVPETLVPFVIKDQVYEASFPAITSLTLKARVIEVGSQAEAANSFPVTLLITDRSPNLKAGMTAEVDFTFIGQGRTGYSGGIIPVPPTALMAGPGQTAFVFVYDPDQKTVHKRSVQTENVINNQVMLSKGLKSGEIIATAGVPYLHDGQKVSLLGVGPERYHSGSIVTHDAN